MRHAIAVLIVPLVVVAACDPAAAPSPSGLLPGPTAAPTVGPAGDRPSIAIDETFTVAGGRWRFSARVDPRGVPTDVVLQSGPGPITEVTWTSSETVASGLLDPATVAGSPAVPGGAATVCVRFVATNAVGTSATRAMCVPSTPPALPGASPIPSASGG